ncbi:hypothetical protein ASD8599_02027 [Ascidiaceihabitans donghaensis]|uniref:HTH araC/xylS-type domain-containing protein n=1 Tax=Ascidiaceihabitans donghaensis TaxID=1510460 RepID=A0A2R8BDX9_9RHOB|nr:helix-turn-helix transcriptional regulator [Ascidiaceihabitans donghaensis]SPH21275.1 hypothetical protein ASD8599_02027 [Ascidiaceihabitans donghaensis]
MTNTVQITTLGTLTSGQDWRVTLPHAQPYPQLFWITRGQGVLMLGGTRRGVGTHNLIYVPAFSLMSLEMGRQSMGLVATCPLSLADGLPETPRQLRIRDVSAISELTGLFEAAQREAASQKPFFEDALAAHMGLISVWLRRQLALPENAEQKEKAAARLAARFCTLVSAPDASLHTMADHAETLGVTPTHLTRACKAATGRTAADILTQSILHKALCALRDTDATAKTISQQLHFGSPAYFTRFIQHHTGSPPSSLR